MNKLILKRESLFLISSSIILIDQLSKSSIVHLLEGKDFVPLIPNFLHLHLIRNTGAAFSLFSKSTLPLAFLSLFVSIGLIVWIYKSKQLSLWNGLGLASLLGGSIGNGIDRWRLGYVNAFIELIPGNFPIFNIADIAINFAIICLLIDTLSKRKIQSY